MIAYPIDFWSILSKFSYIKNLSDLTNVILSMEENGFNYDYPEAFRLLVDFESSMRSHIYSEWHAQEFDYDSETTNFT